MVISFLSLLSAWNISNRLPRCIAYSLAAICSYVPHFDDDPFNGGYRKSVQAAQPITALSATIPHGFFYIKIVLPGTSSPGDRKRLSTYKWTLTLLIFGLRDCALPIFG